MMTAEQIYDQEVSLLPTAEQFRLATLIMVKIPTHSIVDYSEEWSDEDIQEVTRYSLLRAASALGES